MDENIRRQAAVLRAKGDHAAANGLEIDTANALIVSQKAAADTARLQKDVNALTSAMQSLRTAFDAAVAEAKHDSSLARKALLDTIPEMRRVLDEAIERKVFELGRDMELQFGVALTADSRSKTGGANDGEVKKHAAQLESLERRASRQGDHLSNLETRMKKMERE